MKSAKAHLVKFLFMLPLLAVLLLAFRNGIHKNASKKEPILTVSGLVIDAITKTPLAGVSVHEINSNAVATSDNRGFFSIAIPMTHNPLQTEVWFRKDGFENIPSNSIITTQKSVDAIGTIEIIGMTKKGVNRKNGFVQSFALSDQNSFSTAPTYDEVLKNFMQTKAFREGENAPSAALTRTGIDTLPAPPPPSAIVRMPDENGPPEDYKDFLKRNPNVRNIHWGEHTVTIELKSGGKETYNWNDAKSMAAAERKWGKLPVAPPPPPPAPVVAPPPPPIPPKSSIKNKSDDETTKASIEKQEAQNEALEKVILAQSQQNDVAALNARIHAHNVALEEQSNQLQRLYQQKQLAALQQQNQQLESFQAKQEMMLQKQKAAMEAYEKKQLELQLKNAERLKAEMGKQQKKADQTE